MDALCWARGNHAVLVGDHYARIGDYGIRSTHTLLDGRWRVLLPTLHVADVEHTWFRLGFAIDAASFSPDGRRLATVGDELVVIDVEARAIAWRGPMPGTATPAG